MTTWYVLDMLTLIGLVVVLICNFVAKRDATGPDPSEAVTRQYLEVNVLFYAMAAITILFLHNWLALLALGSDSLDGNLQAWVIWAVVDTLLPITLGISGCHLWCGTSDPKEAWREDRNREAVSVNWRFSTENCAHQTEVALPFNTIMLNH